MTEKMASYKSSTTTDEIRTGPTYGSTKRITSPEPIDSLSNIRVSGLKNNSARRDSWDVLNKTRNILSHNSLESLANMPESQLSTDLSFNRPKNLDTQTEYNTRYNKFELVEKRSVERRGSEELSDRYRLYS